MSFKILQHFAYLNGMVKDFSKIILSFYEHFICKHFYYFTGFCNQNFLCGKLANFLQILEVEPKIFQIMNHLSYLDIKHGI